MKTKITIIAVLLSLVALAAFFSCDNTLALGKRLDVEGPIVTITSPSQRQTVSAEFEIHGTTWDYTGVEILSIKAVKDNVEFPRQWRYQRNGWEISDNSGKTWSPLAGAAWDIDKDLATWKIPVKMSFENQATDQGEYTFNIQATDKGGFSDDKSYKALVIIVDLNPPKVEITNPVLYKTTTDPDFVKFYPWADDEKMDPPNDKQPIWQDPALLGKFITQAFDLKWQIDDLDVWSIDLRFYPYVEGEDDGIDNDHETPLPENYIYRYSENTNPPKPPMGADPSDYIKLNGTARVPDLYGGQAAGTYDGQLKNPIGTKTTVKVVAVCYDAAGNPNQEKTLGYFISWPAANRPWIAFAEGLKGPEDFYGKQVAYDETKPGADYIEKDKDLYTVYPSRNIKATAYQAFGVKEVKYTLYEADITGNNLNNVPLSSLKVIEAKTIQSTPGKPLSTIFPWELIVPPFTGYYIFEAEAFNSQNKGSGKYTMFFRVNDITFPDFVEGPLPSATEPLFMSITSAKKIRIYGKVSDATRVESLCMAWINPQSEDFAAMSQLAFFRDSKYKGWTDALIPGATFPVLDKSYDDDDPNKIWKLTLTPDVPDRDPETNRKVYKFSHEIDIVNDLGIGPSADLNALKSQVFLFRAENPDGKCTIITYAPQGDTLAPVIEISYVRITSGSAAPETFEPNTYKVIPQFKDGDKIFIQGTWWEDSAQYLNIQEYFLDNFEINVNNAPLRKLTTADITGIGIQAGIWRIEATVGNGPDQVPLERLKDTLVIDVKTNDIGGNVAQAGSSWLIQSDNLRLMRISSEKEDGIYTVGEKIDIFLEFSKPVLLTYASQKPELILNSNAGNNARAVYKDGQTNLNSRQVFEYTVAAGQSADFLNVKGLYANGAALSATTAFNTANYPFSWSRGTTGGGDYEEVRITMQPNNKGDIDSKVGSYFVRTLPTTETTSNSDYQFTLRAGKSLKIDTAAPTLSSVAAATIAGDYKSGDIYITLTFNKDVITGASTPKLTLNVTGGGDPTTSPDNVRVNGKTITFMYKIKDGDTTNGSQVQVTGFSGSITDLAGNAFSGAMSGTLSGIYIDTIPLNDPPLVRVLRVGTNNTNNVVTNTVGTNTVRGESAAAVVNLSTLYNTPLWLAVQRADSPSTQAHRAAKLEYSINNGTTWIEAGNTTFTAFATPSVMTRGSYQIIARQTTKSGIVSPTSRAINLNWDPGNFMTRVTSTSANGTYTNNTTNEGSRADTIPITVTFRKGVKFSAAPTITLNTTPAATVTAAGTFPNTNPVTELTFNYAVGANHNTTGNLNITAFNLNGGNAQDADNVNVNTFVTPLPAAASLLGTLKEIKIQTGALSVSTAAAFDDSLIPTGIRGIRDDGYNTALVIVFNNNIVKGAGEITIIQRQTGYRLPAVLTESQFSKYSSVANVNTYYTRGSNGYINDANGRRPDTSTKYILRYDVDTAATANAPNASGTGIPKLAEDFRQAEKITLSINADAVRIGTGAQANRLIVELTGSNALQVPGATYAVSYPKGFVQDSLSTPCPAVDGVNMGQALGGMARPFIRINKKQDTIETRTASDTQPRLVATQPLTANVRMDCRTPDSSIRYNIQSATTNVSAVNWSTGSGPGDSTNPALPTRPADPASGNPTTYSNPITIGEDSGNNAYQGLQWYVRAKARNGTGTAVWSADSDEMAFKTVITYVINDMRNNDNGQPPESGDQIWIRGGDAIGLSSVPGFPLNWDINEFDAARDEKRRAGIRLFTMDQVGNSIKASSRWRFVTWEINVETYFDIILGRDTASIANEAWQYGPRQFAYQRAGWTSYKTETRALPGKHRWLLSTDQEGGKGRLNFSGTFGARPQFTGANITLTQPQP
jgi:hypothetical protein